MVTIIKKLAVIAVCFLVIDQAAGLFLDLCRDKSPDGRYYKTKHSLETSDEDMDRMYALQLRGPFQWMQALIPVMEKQGGGSIIQISSATAISSGEASGKMVPFCNCSLTAAVTSGSQWPSVTEASALLKST